MKRYEVIEHTADVGIRARGETMGSLFANAGEALFDLICGIENISGDECYAVSAEACDPGGLMVAWLGNLLLKFELERMLSREFEIRRVEPGGISALVRGERFSPLKHDLRAEVKGVTYHRLKVAREGDGWVAEVILDV